MTVVCRLLPRNHRIKKSLVLGGLFVVKSYKRFFADVGRHEFPFRVAFPATLLSNFDGLARYRQKQKKLRVIVRLSHPKIADVV